MTVQQAVQAYLDHVKSSGYSNNERARKTRILNRWFTPALALYHLAIPSTIAALSVSDLPVPQATKATKRFLEIFHNDNVSITYLKSGRVFRSAP